MSHNLKFQVDLKSIIDLFSNHLYSGRQVFIREMLQNAYDAIIARQQLNGEDGDGPFEGRIELEVLDATPDSPPTLVVRDNGVGLTESEVHQFLATIGQSSKRDVGRQGDFIGQFGIGLLSAFLVCDEVVMITRSARPGQPALKWTGRADGTYGLNRLDTDIEPGTQVFLRAKPGCEDYLTPSFVERQATRYGKYLPMQVEVQSGNQNVVVNQTPPWKMARAQALGQGEILLGEPVLDALPIDLPELGIEGVAYVVKSKFRHTESQHHQIYLKNMFLMERADNLLPEWAFFVRCALNVTDLRPTASREAFYEDERLEQTRKVLGRVFRDYLTQLHRDRPTLFLQLIELHLLAFQALALEDDDFYRLVIQWLPFETTEGFQTLEAFRRDHPGPIRYVATDTEFKQLKPVATAQGLGLINGGIIYVRELLERLPLVDPTLKIDKIDAREFSQEHLQDLSVDERRAVMDLLRTAEAVLQPFHVRVSMRKFHPGSLPSLYLADRTATFMRSARRIQETSDSLFSGLIDSAIHPRGAGQTEWCLNLNNSVIRKLISLHDQNVLQECLLILYIQALSMARVPLDNRLRECMGQSLLKLIEYSTDSATPKSRESQ